MLDFVADCNFAGKQVNLDGTVFDKCIFQNCKMIYSGGDLPQMSNCSMNDCQWSFEGPAARTLAFIRAIYHGLGQHGEEYVESIFEGIREANLPQPHVGQWFFAVNCKKCGKLFGISRSPAGGNTRFAGPSTLDLQCPKPECQHRAHYETHEVLNVQIGAATQS
jgi:hypothetical protein